MSDAPDQPIGKWAKLGIEIATLILALVGAYFAYLGYYQTQNSLRLAAYQQLISHSLQYDKELLKNPGLRPYFKEGVRIQPGHEDYNKAAVLAELQLDIISGIMSFPLDVAESDDTKETWHQTFGKAFKYSPIMCRIAGELWIENAKDPAEKHIQEIAKANCSSEDLVIRK
jgi:hypothetical protein